MPKIRRRKLPERLLVHLLTRVRQRSISCENLVLLARWLDTEPEVPAGRWFKRFPGFTVCGEGELITTFLLAGQAPDGHEIG
jgi:ribosomal protein S18 acetylase RimI-like enzyme